MNEDYLWDRSGEPDAEIARLEGLLGQLRYSGQAPEQRRSARRFGRPWWVAAAAVVLAGVGIVARMHEGPVTLWQLSVGDQNARAVRAGQMIETGTSTHARLESTATGQVDIDPKSRLRLVAAGDKQEIFDLQRGTIHAFIWAPPGRFVVDTPSSKTIDLGCRYTLQVSENGTGLLTVETGWVAFEWQKRESFIPAGAACVTRPRLGPGTPYFADAPAEFRAALDRFDTKADTAALTEAIGAARPRDAVSLWHLLIRTEGSGRGAVFDRFATLVHLPEQVTKAAVLRGDAEAIDGAWNALGLGETTWWRNWKRSW